MNPRQPTLFPIEDELAPAPTPATAAEPPKPAVRVRGFACPRCVGVRLMVYRTRRPMRGLVVRYRECSACRYRTTTEERVGHPLPPPSGGAHSSGAAP